VGRERAGKDDAGSRPRRGSATAIARPRITVVHGTAAADPGALDDVLELLVAWALRAHEARRAVAVEAASGDDRRGCGADN
jgi:hypothetical protein